MQDLERQDEINEFSPVMEPTDQGEVEVGTETAEPDDRSYYQAYSGRALRSRAARRPSSIF
jgi:hypothetical protein